MIKQELNDMELYVQILVEIQIAVNDNDVDRYKLLCALINYINEYLNCEKAKKFKQTAYTSLGKGNLICRACKSGAMEVLVHLLSNEDSVCSLPYLAKKITILPDDEDDEGHNAIYYAIRSNKTQIFEILLDKWLNDCFKKKFEKLDNLLSKALKDLTIRNIHISEDMKTHIKRKLVDFRFFHEISPQQKNTGNLTQNFKKLVILRIDYVLQHIVNLVKKFVTLEPNEEFLLYSKYIAKNIDMLKSSMTFADRLPWEEIGFCLIIFIRSCQSGFRKHPLYQFVLNKDRFLMHLETFSQILIKLKDKIKRVNKSKKGKLVIDRINGIELKDFQELYDDFRYIRDLYSLEEIKNCIDLAMSANTVGKFDQLVIIRALQVIGEYMKNTVDSPNLSDDTYNLLISTLPDNLKDVITSLRDSLSHVDSLFIRSEIEASGQHFFKSLQLDFIHMNLVVNDTIRIKKSIIIENLLNKMRECKDIDSMKLFLKQNHIIGISLQKEMEDAPKLELIGVEHLEKLVLELQTSIERELNCSMDLIRRVLELVQNTCDENAGGSSDFFKSDLPTDPDEIRKICTDFLYLTLMPQETQFGSFNVPKNTETLRKTLSDILYINEFKTGEYYFQKIDYYSNFSDLPEFVLKLRKEKESRTIQKEDIEECKKLIIDLKKECAQKVDRVKRKFVDFNSIIQREKRRLKDYQNNFQSNLGDLITAINITNENYSNASVTLLLDFEEKFNNLTLRSLSNDLFTEIVVIFKNIYSELARDSFTSRENLSNAISNLHTFIGFRFGKIKWIKEFKQILQSHKKQELSKSLEKIPELENQIENLLSRKLHLLEEINNEYKENRMVFSKSQCSPKNLKLLSVIEMLMLDSLIILEECFANRVTFNAFFLDNDYPIVNGRNLRNHLAHTNALVSVILEANCTDLLLNAEKMIAYDKIKSDQQIGKKIINYPQRLKDSLDGDLAANTNQIRLFTALTEGKMETVKDCIGKGADIYATDLYLQNSLHFAAKGPDLKTVKFVLKFDLNVSARDSNFQTALHIASFHGRLAVVEHLIKNFNPSINCKDLNRRTPLHLASMKGHKDIVKFLLRYQAKTELKDIIGNTALHYAVTQNHSDVANILLKKEPNVSANKTIFGLTALHLASENGHKNLVIDLLEKMNVNFRTNLHFVPLHYAAKGGYSDVVEFLILKGADVNAKSLNGTSPLHLAAEKGHYSTVATLLEHEVDINAADFNGWTPLRYAVRGGFLETSKLLLKKGAVVDEVKNSMRSPLNLAAKHGHDELVKTLFPKCSTRSKISALRMAAYKGHLSIVKLLVNECGENYCTELHLAAFEGHTDVVDFLISKGCDVNAKIDRDEQKKELNHGYDDDWRHALSLFVRRDDFNDASQLFLFLQLGCGQTALHRSAYRVHKNTVRSLLKNHADIQIEDDSGTTPLQLIIENGMGNILVEEKVPVTITDSNHSSPLHLGAIKGDLPFVKYCIEHNKSDPNCKGNQFEKTALDLAVAYGHAEVVRYLIEDATISPEIIVQESIDNSNNTLRNKGLAVSSEKEREYLLLAVKSGCEDIVEYFLNRNLENAVSRPECHEFPLHDAVSFGHLNIVEKLLEKERRADINHYINDTGTPIQIASVNGYCEIARILLSKGADPNVMSDLSPPLHLAVLKGHSEMAEILIKDGADITLRDSDGYSAVDLAIKCQNKGIMEAFLDYTKLDIHLKEYNGRTLLHEAAGFGSLIIVKYLVDKGADVNNRDCTGSKPIHIATKEGHQDIVEYFLSEGLDIEDRGLLNFWSLLHYAAAGNQSEIFKFLFENGLHVNIVDENGSTPLHIAALENNADFLHTLLHYGAYYDFRNKRNETPFNVAMAPPFRKHIPIFTSLTLISSLFSAVQKNDLPKVEGLLNEGLRFSRFGYANVKNMKNISLLHYAAWEGFEEIVDLLLKYNADPNVRAANGSTPLHYAAKFSHSRIANSLLRNGAIFDIECNFKKKPIDYTADKDIIKILETLKSMFSMIENGEISILDSLNDLNDLDFAKAVLRAKNSLGKTLSAIAVIKQHPEVDSLTSLFQPDLSMQRQRADILYGEEKFEECLQQYLDMLEKRIDIFGEKDPGVLNIQEAMSEIFIKQEKYDRAQNLIENILRIRKEILGDCNIYTLSAMRLKALILGLKGKKNEGLNMCEEVLTKQRKTLGLDHIETLRTQIQIFQLTCEEETDSENLIKMLETLEKLNKFTEITRFILELKIQIAEQLRRLGKFNEALDVLEDVLVIQKEKLGLNHTQTSNTLFQMGGTLLAMGEEENSLKAFRESFEIRHRILGPKHKKTLHTRYWEANALYSQGMVYEAFQIYNEDLEARRAVFGANHPAILDTCEKIDLLLPHVSSQ